MIGENERFKVVDAKFPKIGKRIAELWGKPGLVAYINKVIDDSRASTVSELPAKVELALYGLRKEHDQLFGRQPAAADASALTDNEHFKKVSAQYTRIAKELIKLWGGPECCGYINTLLQDTRGGTRQGFPPDVAKALFMLMQKHDKDFPQHALKVGDIWTGRKSI